MATTNDPEHFTRRWDAHIDELDSLKHSLHPDEWDELEECQETLKRLTRKAAGTLDD